MKRLLFNPELDMKAHLTSSAFTKAQLTVMVVCLLLMFAAPAIAKVASLKGQFFDDEQTVSGADLYLFTLQGTKYRRPVTTEQSGLFAIEAVDDGIYCLMAFVGRDQIGSSLINTSNFSSGYTRVNLDHGADCTNGSGHAVFSDARAFAFGLTALPGAFFNLFAAKQSRDVPSLEDRVLIDAFCSICAIIVIYPILRYLFHAWAFRRDRLFGLLKDGAIVFYYKQFHPTDPPPKSANTASPTVADYMVAFTRDFDRWYGRRYYIAPLLMLAILSGIATWWGARNLQGWIIDRSSLDTLRALVASALAGAFVWIISDELDRLRRRDFTTSDVYYYVFRLLLSVPFGWALTRATVTLQVGIPLAFFLGSFPTTTLFTIARRLGSQQLKLGDDASSGTLELENLQSIGKPNAERFKDEGITTISGLAYADPIDLTIRTNFDFNYVVDCVSQALTWIYFGKDCQALFPLSLRGAQEVSSVAAWLDDPGHQESAKQTLADAALRLNISQGALRTTLCQIAEDPYTKFLVDIWS